MNCDAGGRDDQGSSTAVTFLLGLAFIVIPVLVIVLTLPAWEQRVVDADDAARLAASSLANADNWSDGVNQAEAAVWQVVAGQGLSPDDVAESFAGSLQPGSQVTASVTVTVPLGAVPGLGRVGDLHYTATSTAHVASYEDSPS